MALLARRRPFRRRRPGRSALVAAAALTGLVLSVLPARAALAGTAPDSAGAGAFATSFEPADPAPRWQDTADDGPAGRPAVSGVYPDTGSGLPGSVMSTVATVAADDEVLPDGAAAHVADGDPNTSWQAASSTPDLSLTLSSATRVATYAMTSASDSPARDPRSWSLQGSSDGRTWKTLDTRSGQTFGQRSQTRIFTVRHSGSYSRYRLAVTANHGDSHTQLAELVLGAAPSADEGMTTSVGDGPASSPTAKTHAGFTGTHALHYAGWQLGGSGTARDKIYEVSLPVRANTRLSYRIFPEFTGKDLAYPSSYVSVDLAFSDGTYLSGLRATDQNGKDLSARAQGAAEVLQTDQWNEVTADIGAVAAGKTVTRVLVDYDAPGPAAHFGAGSTTSPSPPHRPVTTAPTPRPV